MEDEFIKNINGKTADEWFNIALDEKDLDKQIEYYSNCLKLNPEHIVAWYNKGIVLYILEKYEDAIKAYDKAIEINPKDAFAWNNKGLALGELKKYDDAIKAYNKAIEIEDYAYDNLRDFKKAIEYHEKSLKIAKAIGDKAEESICLQI